MHEKELSASLERISSKLDRVSRRIREYRSSEGSRGSTAGSDAAPDSPHDVTDHEHGNGTRASLYEDEGVLEHGSALSSREHRPGVANMNTESLFERLLQQIVTGHHTNPDLGVSGHEARQLIDETPDIVIELDQTGIISHVNPGFSDAFGYPHSEIVGSAFMELVDDAYRHPLRARMRDVLERGDVSRVATPDDIVLFRAAHRRGHFLSLEGLLSTFADNAGRARIVVVMRDLSEHRSLLEELQESKDNYDALSETITEAIVRLDEDFTIVYANAAVKTTFGYDPEELRGQPFRMLFPPAEYQRHEEAFRKYFFVDDRDRSRIGLQNTVEVLGKHKHRGIAPMEVSFGNSKDYDGRTLTCIIRDITRRKNAERRLRHLAYHDQLTGLGNRDLFNSDVRTIISNLRAAGTGYAAVMFLDLDGFKQVNDTLGHEAGDNLLIETAKRLGGSLRESDSVYRFGGDEFVVVLSFVHQPRDAALVANKLIAALRRPYELEQSSQHGQGASNVTVGVSIGIALAPTHGEDIESLTKAADLAMYSAKEAGKSQFAFYTSELNVRAVEHLELEQGIRAALEQGNFSLHYQPLVDSEARIKGVEALLRWYHEEKGWISPDRFIPVAEESGLILPLGNWVIETALRDLRLWNEDGHRDLYVAINLSPKQFEQKDLVEMLGRALRRSGVKASNIKLEITETSIMAAPHEAMRKMRTLKERYPGLTIAIDDFGTGHSSLGYLSNLPADIIKIDLSFVANLFAKGNQKIVRAIIGLAHSLGLEVVAEGVESGEQWEYFREHACETLQGFHFNPPLPSGQIRSVLQQGPSPGA
jgi:diguanylate cyclase (GGDEF)-like protein/PAS domain S-box-containing protein